MVNRSAALGAEGLSQYNLVGNRTAEGWPYAQNMAFERRWWMEAASLAKTEKDNKASTILSNTGLVVPVSAGWDSRPRQEVVMPWGDTGNKRCLTELGHECWLEDPTLSELTAQTKAALEFAESKISGEIKSVLISAWNENDEGHWIVPSLLGGPARRVRIGTGRST
eukprot:SAG31_NODE_7215_length_1753_cov_1.231560_1_plen_167_part_00